jgi:hypothetical protein
MTRKNDEMEFLTLVEKLKKIKKSYRESLDNFISESLAAFGYGCVLLFKKHKKLESFGWVQYTPYEDGSEACTFAAYIDDPIINEMEVNEIYEKDPQLSKAADDIIDFLTLFQDEILRQMFGDHVLVVVTRDGVDLKSYAHN